jgi:hypothetical protein
MVMREYPRIVFVGASFYGGNDATAITLRSLGAEFPQEHLFHVCSEDAVLGVMKSGLIGFNILIGKKRNRLQRKVRLGLGPVIGAGEVNMGLLGKILVRFRVTLRALRDSLSWPVLREKIRIQTFRPDVIYALGGSIAWIRLASKIGRIAKRPLVIHFMDDWASTLYKDAYFAALWEFLLKRALTRALKQGEIHITISDDMAHEYEKRYKKKFVSFMRCIEPNSQVSKATRAENGRLRLVYCGGLHLGRWAVLRRLGHLMRDDLDLGHTLSIFAPATHLEEIARSAEGLPAIILGGSISPDQEHAILSSFDIAVHVESFDARTIAYSRLSISTKIPLYFSIPLPIFAIGPTCLSSIRWIEAANAGIVVDGIDDDKLANGLKRLLDTTVRRKCATAAFAKYREAHNANIVRRRFLILMKDIRMGMA